MSDNWGVYCTLHVLHPTALSADSYPCVHTCTVLWALNWSKRRMKLSADFDQLTFALISLVCVCVCVCVCVHVQGWFCCNAYMLRASPAARTLTAADTHKGRKKSDTVPLRGKCAGRSQRASRVAVELIRHSSPQHKTYLKSVTL